MLCRLAMMAAAAVSLAMTAGAAVTTVAVRGDAPMDEGGFQLRQTTVHYGDLNIANKAGATQLLTRIRDAAADSCNSAAMPTQRIKDEVRQCRDKAVKQAVARVHSSELTMVANAQ